MLFRSITGIPSGTVSISGSGSGTTDRIPKFTGALTIGDSNWQDSSGNLSSLTPGKTISVPGLGTNSEQFGLAAVANATDSLAIGNTATIFSGASETVLIGRASTALNVSVQSVGIGKGVYVSGPNSVSIGYGANSNTNDVVIGKGAVGTSYGVAIGSPATASTSSVAIGVN